MKHYAHEQRSADWHKARIGIPTASSFNKVMMGKGSKTRQDYMCRLVMERILGRSLEEGVKTKWMLHGINSEDDAVAEFCATSNLAVSPCGFFTDMSGRGRYGCSPDRLIKDRDALLEVKCPAPWTHCRYHVFGPGDDYKAQVQGQMLVTGLKTVYFFSYFPGLPSYMLETKRDEKYIKELKTELDNFCDDLDKKTHYIGERGMIDLEQALGALAVIMPEDD
jgi:YqaJ-like viral recombinase domain